MDMDVKFNEIWKICTECKTQKDIRTIGKKAIRDWKRYKDYDFEEVKIFVMASLVSTDLKEIDYMNREEILGKIYFYKFAKKPNFIATLINKYLY